MSDNKNSKSTENENISNVLDMLKKSYGEESRASTDADPMPNKTVHMSEDELKEKLRAEFFSSDTANEERDDDEADGYTIDENFFAEAELAQETENEQLVVTEAVADNVVDNDNEIIGEFAEDDIESDYQEEDLPPWEEAAEAYEDTEENINFTEPQTDSIEESAVPQLPNFIEKSFALDTEQLSVSDFDVETEELSGDDVALAENTAETEDDIPEEMTFEDLEYADDGEGDIETFELKHLELDEISEQEYTEFNGVISAENINTDTGLYEKSVQEDDIKYPYAAADLLRQDIPLPPAAEEFSVAYAEDNSTVDEQNSAVKGEHVIVDEEFLEEIIPEEANTEHSIDSSEISLLMQFGCENEILSHVQKEALQEIADENALNGIAGAENFEENEQNENSRDKISAYYRSIIAKRDGILIKLLISAIPMLALLFYEGLPIIGVDFPGIMNKEDYFISYLLLGLQLVVLCALPFIKKIVEGAKKLISLKPDGFSLTIIVFAVLLLYDVSAMFSAKDAALPVFHFAFSCAIIFAGVREYQKVSTEIKSFEFYFSETVVSRNEDVSSAFAGFTLNKSTGSRSTAEKMYSGGLNSNKNVYFPIDVESPLGFFAALKKKNDKEELSLIYIITVFAFSVVCAIIGIVSTGRVYVAFSAMLTALLIAMPTVSVLFKHLPFQVLTAKARSEGYAFADENNIKDYGSADVMIFKDMHLFCKVPPSSINLALYDATPKDVLLGCLDSVYSSIGGPMSDSFVGGRDKRFEKCSISRIAKRGVEAVVGNNYSVLIGSEQFMSRYGISFPNVTFGNKDDEIFALCVSINGRASARIAAKYTVNDVFNMFALRLAEDDIYCAVETYDPLISTKMLSKLLPPEHTPISIVHLNADDLNERSIKDRDKILFEVGEFELGLLARSSRLNLVVALSSAKKLIKLKKYLGFITYGMTGVCGALIMLLAAFGAVGAFGGGFVLAYWILACAAWVASVVLMFPRKNRFSYERYLSQQEYYEE